MLTLYHSHDARSFRPLWTLEEMGLSYELKMLPFPPRAAVPDYLTVDPPGTVPTFFDGNMRMTESAAICQYLVTRYGPTPLAVETSEPDFGPYLNWLYFGEATLTFPQTIVLRYSLFEPPERRSEQVAADYSQWFLSRLRGVDAVVSPTSDIVWRTLHRRRYLGRFRLDAGRIHRLEREVFSGCRGLLAIAERTRWLPQCDRQAGFRSERSKRPEISQTTLTPSQFGQPGVAAHRCDATA